jgi:hypothetical protein
MRDFKCVACRIRTRRTAVSAHEAGDACPSCGSPLQRVGELAELVGFRWVTTSDGNEIYAQRVSDALAAERWANGGPR